MTHPFVPKRCLRARVLVVLPAFPVLAVSAALAAALAGCGAPGQGEALTVPAASDAGGSVSKTTSALTAGGARSAPGFTALLDKARKQGTARVIVQLNTSVALEATLANDQVADQRQRIKAHQAS